MLSKTAIEAIDNSETLKGKIADSVGKKVTSVMRWIIDEENGDESPLSTRAIVLIISAETGLTEDEILNQPVTK